MAIVFSPFDPEQEDRTRRFQVHKNYVQGIAMYLEDQYGTSGRVLLENLVQAQRQRRSFQKIQRRAVSEEFLVQYLTLSWASELQFRLADLTDARLLQYSNAWAPIHAYYSVYMAAQAWFVCLGAEELVDNHTGSLNNLSNEIGQRNLFPLPWGTRCSGCPHLGECQFERLPPEAEINREVELLSNPSPDDFWARYCKMLETTRRRRLDRNINEWKRRNRRKKTFAKEKRQIAKSLMPTTMFDFFWRLRVRSNYRDVRSFLMAGVSEQWQEDFRLGLERVMESSVMLLESLVMAYAGSDVYDRIVGAFLDDQRDDLPELSGPLETRRELLLG